MPNSAGKLLLGPYLLLEPLGRGHLGTVFLALHRSDRRRFALKVLPIRSLWKVLQAKKQADFFQALPPHWSLVTLADIDTTNGSHFLAWPFVEGETLEARVCRLGPLHLREACRIFSEIAEGLSICHRAGLYHGLVNPGNILIGLDGRARILDLGIGAILAENFEVDSMLDTLSSAKSALDMLEYSAPETIADPAIRSPAADAYSLGCTLYAALIGTTPFQENSVVEKMIAHQTRIPKRVRELAPALPVAVEKLVESMMRKIPGERPTLPEVKEALDAIAAGLPDDPLTTVALGKFSLGFEKIEALLAEASAPETPVDKPPST